MGRISVPDKSFSLNFFLDKGRDKQILFNWFKSDDPAGLEPRALEKGISVEFAYRLRDAKTYADIKDEIDAFIDPLYESQSEQIKLFMANLEDFWGRHLEQLVEIVKEITERPFYYAEYQVLVSVCHMGMVSGGISNDIGVGINLSPDWRSRILAHELVEEHWRKILREEELTKKLDDWYHWALSEIGAVLVLKDVRLKSLWSPLAQEIDEKGYFARSNYPQLAAAEAELSQVFSKRRSFRDFLSGAIAVLTKYSK